jgi:osmoprotectant transport system substrate-binding protein
MWLAVVLGSLVPAVALTGCITVDLNGDAAVEDHRSGDVRVASFDFPESELLGELLAQLLERAGVPVERRLGLGSREIVEPALRQGVVDVVPEYLAAAVEFDSLGETSPPASAEQAARDLTASFRQDGVTELAYAPAIDRDAFAMRADRAAELGVVAIRDLGPNASELDFVAPPECPERPACLPRLESDFGLHFRSFSAVPPGLAVALALESGEADVGLMFTSDPLIRQHGLVLLQDEPGAERPEHVVPLIRDEVLERPGGASLVAAIDAAMQRLTTEELVELNRQVSLGRSVRSVAQDWLEKLPAG